MLEKNRFVFVSGSCVEVYVYMSSYNTHAHVCSRGFSISLPMAYFSNCFPFSFSSLSLTSNSWLIRSSHFLSRLVNFSFSFLKFFISVFRFCTLKYFLRPDQLAFKVTFLNLFVVDFDTYQALVVVHHFVVSSRQ